MRVLLCQRIAVILHSVRTIVNHRTSSMHDSGKQMLTGNFCSKMINGPRLPNVKFFLKSEFSMSKFSGQFSELHNEAEHKTKDSLLHDPEPEDQGTADLFSGLNAVDARKLKIIQLEYDVWESTGDKLPSNMTDQMWLQLLQECQTVMSRRKIYRFWFKREKARESALRKKEERKALKVQRQDEPKDDFYENRFIQKIAKSKMNQDLYSQNMAFSMIHGPHLVLDFGFQGSMQKRELNNLVDQIIESHGVNHVQSEPFHLHFCNVDPNSVLTEILYKRFHGLPDLLYTVSEDHYLDHYTKDKLVYLSPNARELMTEFSYDDTYILGGIVDRSGQDPLTFAKSKREGIRSVRLPLDKYLIWQQGSKALTLDQMIKILSTLKQTNSDWRKALTHVPKRKFTWR